MYREFLNMYRTKIENHVTNEMMITYKFVHFEFGRLITAERLVKLY